MTKKATPKTPPKKEKVAELLDLTDDDNKAIHRQVQQDVQTWVEQLRDLGRSPEAGETATLVVNLVTRYALQLLNREE